MIRTTIRSPPSRTAAATLAGCDGHEDNILPSGLPVGSPEEALDRVCGLYLNGPTGLAPTSTNQRHGPLGHPQEHGLRGLAVLDGVDGDEPDLLILDVMMPRLGGVEICRRLRAAGRDLPVLMLTVRDQVSDRVAGLDAGADDYLPEPFAIEELLARVRRRAPGDNESQILTFADVWVDPDRFEAWRGGRSLRLTRTEFFLLEVLVRNATRVLTRGEHLEQSRLLQGHRASCPSA